MNKLSIYLLLILTYLGVARSFAPIKNNTLFIPNKYALADTFRGSPVTVILVDILEAGLIMKTYFQKYLIIKGFEDPKYITVQTKEEFWQQSRQNIGMSIFRRHENKNKTSIVPMPPGFLYIGDPSYGYWKYNNAGVKKWHFYKAYQSFPKLFSYGKFSPSYTFIKTARVYHSKEVPFYGLNKEFGLGGTITTKYLKAKYLKPKKEHYPIIAQIKKLFTREIQ